MNDTPHSHINARPAISLILLFSVLLSACGGGGSSSDSGDNDTPSTPIPSVPNNLSAQANGSDQINLSWDFVANVSRYDIYRSNNNSTASASLLASVNDPNASSYSDNNVSHQSLYYYWIQACNANGCSTQSGVTQAQTPLGIPPAPSTLSAQSSGSNAIQITWQAGPSDYQIQHYRLYASTSNDNSALSDSTHLISTISSLTLSHLHTGLRPNTSYYYWLRAQNASGLSAYSPVAQAQTALTAPSTPQFSSTVRANPNQIQLDWSAWANSNAHYAISSYSLYRSTDTANLANASTLSLSNALSTDYTDNNVLDNTDYSYWLRAQNAEGSTLSAPQSLRIAIPTTPSNLTAQANGSSAIQLNWDSVNGSDYYQIHRSLNGAVAGYISSLTQNTQLNYHDNNLNAGNTYAYWIKACNDLGCSNFSSSASVSLLAAPSGLNATVQSSNHIFIYWDEVGTASHYQIHAGSKSDASDRLSLNDNKSQSQHNHRNLSHNSTYYYWVKACNLDGCSDYAGPTSAQTLLAIPPAPSGLSASAQGSNQINLSWTAAASEFAPLHYHLHLGTTANASDRSTLTSNLTQASTSHSGLNLIDATYYYWVQACNNSGCSDYSTPSSAQSNAITLSGINLNNGILSWSSINGVNRYDIQASTHTASSYTSSFQDIHQTPNTSNNLPWLAHTASYRIRGCDDNQTPAACSNWGYLGTPANPSTIASVLNNPIANLSHSGSHPNYTLNWDAFQGSDYYHIQRSTDTASDYASNYQNLATQTATNQDPSYLLPSVASTASYQLRACQTHTSNNSNTAVCNPWAPLAQPGVVATAPFGSYLPQQRFQLLESGISGFWVFADTLWVAEDTEDYIQTYDFSDASGATNDYLDDYLSNYGTQNFFSNGTTLWVANTVSGYSSSDDDAENKIYAYNITANFAGITRNSSLDIDSLNDAGNRNPYGIWSDGSSMYVSDHRDDRIYAYTLSNGQRDTSKEFVLDATNDNARGIWSDGSTLWVADATAGKLFAYALSGGNRQASKDIAVPETETAPALFAGGGFDMLDFGARQLWSDGSTIWINARRLQNKNVSATDRIHAYAIADPLIRIPPNQ